MRSWGAQLWASHVYSRLPEGLLGAEKSFKYSLSPGGPYVAWFNLTGSNPIA